VFSVNEATGNLDFEFRGPEMPRPDFEMYMGLYGNNNDICEPNETCFGSFHSDTFEDTDGQQYIAFTGDLDTPCQREIITARLNKGQKMLHTVASGGGRTDVMMMDLCGGGPLEFWPENHTGCAKQSAFCVFSTNYTRNRDPADLTTPITRTTHLSELIVMRGNGAEIRRVAQTRGIQFRNDWYWSLAKACMSNDGSQVLWDTNFGYPNQGENVAMVDTGFGASTPGASAGATCDLDADGIVNVVDVQLATNQALGKTPCKGADLMNAGNCSVADVQRVINAALGTACKIGP